MTNKVYEKVKSLVKFAKAKILVVDMMGVESYYLANSFNQKAIHQPYNELVKGKCIDKIINDDNITVVDEQNFESLTGYTPEETFKFGHDNYVYFTETL